VEVDLNTITDNYRAITSLLSPSDVSKPNFATLNPRIIPVIKADAFGHGVIPVARALAAAGATMFGVFFLDEAGEPVGYNRKYHASRNMRLTTLCVGYADGFNRLLGNRSSVIIRDKLAPVIEAVSMDMIAVDLTVLPEAGEGDEAIILGSSADCRMAADDLARILKTVPYEVLCAITARIPRIYV
jgi:alanine racemase